MAKPRVTATDRLADIIEVVELGRRTGLLMVERGPVDMLEEGAIFFQAGRAIYAAVERVRGPDALSVLGGWGACRFAFDPQASAPAPNLIQGQPAAPTPPPGYYNTPSQAASRPANPPSWYAPPSPSPASGVTPPSLLSQAPSGQFSASWPDPRAGSYPNLNGSSGVGATNPSVTSPGVSGPSTLPSSWSQSAPATPGQSSPLLPPAATGPALTAAPAARPPARAEAALLRRPRRAPSARDLMAAAQTYGLSRGHRTLLMLADGDHNVIDIARLSSKRIEDVQTLLGELEGHGLVYYS